jgi:hypothetical protein
LLDGNLSRVPPREAVRRLSNEEATMRGHHAISPDALRERIVQLQSEHGELDRLINKLSDSSEISDLELRRLKKRKLKVKDNILLLQLQLEPDKHA